MWVPARNVRGGLGHVGEGRYKCQHKKFLPHKKVLLSTNKKTTTKLTLQNILLKYFTKYKNYDIFNMYSKVQCESIFCENFSFKPP